MKSTAYDKARAIWNGMSAEERKILAYWLGLTYGGMLCKQRQEKGLCRVKNVNPTDSDSSSIA